MVLDPVQIHAEKEHIQDLVEQILGAPSAPWRYSAYSNERFPFRAYASALRGTGPSADEAVVIAVAWQYPDDDKGDHLIVSADILDGEGAVLAEGPRYEVPLPPQAVVPTEPDGEIGAVREQVHVAMQKIGEWLRGEASAIREALA
jgi:hypothetical protein